MKKFLTHIVDRWRAKTPKIFKRIIQVALAISGMAIAINAAMATANATAPAWWDIVYPYVVGVPAGMASVAKLTQKYDKDGNPVYEDNNIEEDEA